MNRNRGKGHRPRRSNNRVKYNSREISSRDSAIFLFEMHGSSSNDGY